MKNIKKKLLSLGLTAAMVASYTPATIFADEIGNQGNVIEVSTYQELKEALGYNKYDAEKGAFVATEGTAKEGDTIKLTADLIAETDKANPKGNKRTGDSATDARFDSTTGATVTVVTNNVTIDGNGHTIDGDGYPTFDFDGVKGAELKNITVEDGAYTAKIGGAIFVEYGAEVSMDNITVKDSSANATSAFNGGGAIYINNHRGDAPKVTITNSQFINNKVGTNGETGNGGAIYGSTANLTVENTTFKGNKAANGGAIAMDGQSEFSSKSNTFKRNKAAVAGGAVYVSHGLSNTKKGMTIDSNVKAQMANSTFKKNSAVLTGDDIAYARYYDETYTGDTSATTLTSDSDFTDVTFADKNRTQIAGVSPDKVYATVDMTYYQYYQNEVSESISKDEDGYYDTVTSATKGSHTGDISTNHNWSSDGTNLTINGMKNVDISIDRAALKGITTATTLDEIKAALAEKGMTLTYYKQSGVLYNADGEKDEDQKLDISSVKALNTDGTYGQSQAVENTEVKDITTDVADGTIVPTLNYNSNYGDIEIDLNYSGIAGKTGMGISLKDDTDKAKWNAYKNAVQGVTLTNEETGEKYGLVWYEDIWSEGSHGSYLQLVLNKEDRVSKGNPIKAGRFKDFSTGTYTATVKAKGYKDVVVSGIKVGELIKNKPTLVNDTYSTEDKYLELELDTTNVSDDYLEAMKKADFTLMKSNNVVDAKITVSKKGDTIVIKNNGLEPGNYTLKASVDGYQDVTYSFTVLSTQEQLSMKVGDKIYAPTDNVTIKPGETIDLVDADGNFVSGYASSATVTVNGTVVPNRGPQAVKVIKYDADSKTCTIDTTSSLFAEEGDYEVQVAVAGYNTYTYKFTISSKTPEVNKDFEKALTINNVKYDATKVTGSGEVGATVTAYVGDEEIGSSIVGEDGKYEIEIPGQAGGTEITVKMSKDGYNTVEATKNVLKQIKDFTVERILPTSTKITGTGMPGAYVKAYVDGEQIGKTAKVGEDGKYSVTIPKQALKTKVTVKISSEGYYRRAKTSTVLNLFKKELTANTVKSTSTKITGKGQAGAYVKATVDGKQIGKTVKVKSNGTYSITIPKQKKGTEIQLKMSKAGTMGVYKTIIVK